jgi:hypothetical protein
MGGPMTVHCWFACPAPAKPRWLRAQLAHARFERLLAKMNERNAGPLTRRLRARFLDQLLRGSCLMVRRTGMPRLLRH